MYWYACNCVDLVQEGSAVHGAHRRELTKGIHSSIGVHMLKVFQTGLHVQVILESWEQVGFTDCFCDTHIWRVAEGLDISQDSGAEQVVDVELVEKHVESRNRCEILYVEPEVFDMNIETGGYRDDLFDFGSERVAWV